MKPLAIDLYSGLGGWSDGFIAEGWDVVGFDIERHVYGDQKYPGQLVLQDVTTLHGSQFRNASCIVASPPCQRYSYMAMPWSRAKREVTWQEWERDSPFGDRLEVLNALFAACFRIHREASEAAGHHIPMVVENVKGAQKWVGRAAWHHGSFFLWGDVPAIMPQTETCGFLDMKRRNGTKNEGTVGGWFNISHGQLIPGNQAGAPQRGDGLKQGGEWWHDPDSITRRTSSRSPARKAASAMIAKIPPELSAYIARYYRP